MDPDGCPRSGGRGRPVSAPTLEALLTPTAKGRLTGDSWLFCSETDCDVVYFDAEGAVFTRAELTVRVGVKRVEAPRPLCYCFGHSVESIEDEVARTGACSVVSSVTEQVKAGNCRCERTNPSGACCLRDLRRAEVAALAHTGARETRTRQAGGWVAGGAIIAAVAASACCWLPLALIGLGVSGASLSAVLEPWRHSLAAASFILLGVAFWLTGRRPVQDDCGSSPDCCAGAATALSANTRPARRASRTLLWIATPISIAFVFYPALYAGLVGASAASTTSTISATSASSVTSSATEPALTVIIEGMTCETCSVAVGHSLRAVPGVTNALVDWHKGRALVFTDKGAQLETPEIRAAIEAAGYRAVSID